MTKFWLIHSSLNDTMFLDLLLRSGLLCKTRVSKEFKRSLKNMGFIARTFLAVRCKSYHEVLTCWWTVQSHTTKLHVSIRSASLEEVQVWRMTLWTIMCLSFQIGKFNDWFWWNKRKFLNFYYLLKPGKSFWKEGTNPEI